MTTAQTNRKVGLVRRPQGMPLPHPTHQTEPKNPTKTTPNKKRWILG